ncbi:hypothetical protein AAH446_13675 [Erwinia sp. P6884]|uniref:hypothetical protein n=1 Tax=Erwinia sp. P6884 TaxID=3141450 RepID=UPI00319545CB
MAKHAFNVTLKFALFFGVMLLVAKYVPYDYLIDRFITENISFDQAVKISGFILGELDPGAYEAMRDYIFIVVNILISVPFFSAIITGLNALRNKAKPGVHFQEWLLSVLRRLMKIFSFILLFWIVLRLLPYEYLFREPEGVMTYLALAAINLTITMVAYCMVKRLIRCTLKDTIKSGVVMDRERI